MTCFAKTVVKCLLSPLPRMILAVQQPLGAKAARRMSDARNGLVYMLRYCLRLVWWHGAVCIGIVYSQTLYTLFMYFFLLFVSCTASGRGFINSFDASCSFITQGIIYTAPCSVYGH